MSDDSVLLERETLVQTIADDSLPMEARARGARRLADLGIQARLSTLPRGTVQSAAELRCSAKDQTRLLHVLEDDASELELRRNLLAALAEWGDENSVDVVSHWLENLTLPPPLQSAALCTLSTIGGPNATAALILAMFRLPEGPQALAQLAQSRLRELITGGDEDISDPIWYTAPDLAAPVLRCISRHRVFERLQGISLEQQQSRWSHLLNLLMWVNDSLKSEEWTAILRETEDHWPAWALGICVAKFELQPAKNSLATKSKVTQRVRKPKRTSSLPSFSHVDDFSKVGTIVITTTDTWPLTARKRAQFEMMVRNLARLQEVLQKRNVGYIWFEGIAPQINAILTKLARQYRLNSSPGRGNSYGYQRNQVPRANKSFYGVELISHEQARLYRQLQIELRRHFGVAADPLLKFVEGLIRQSGSNTPGGAPRGHQQGKLPQAIRPQQQQRAEG